MEYQIVRREEFRIVGFRIPLPMDVEEGFQAVPQFWGETGPRIGALIPLMDPGTPGLLGVSTCHREEENYYYIAVASNAPAPEGAHACTVPSENFSSFSSSAETAYYILEQDKMFRGEWLPDSGYEWAQAPDVEVYLSEPGAEELQFQVWLPIQKETGK